MSGVRPTAQTGMPETGGTVAAGEEEEMRYNGEVSRQGLVVGMHGVVSMGLAGGG